MVDIVSEVLHCVILNWGMAYGRVGQRCERISSDTWQHHPKASFPRFLIHFLIASPICNPLTIILPW